MNSFYSLISIIVSLTVLDISAGQKNGVILIPGIIASRIDAQLDENAQIDSKCRSENEDKVPIWLSSKYLLTHPISCFYDGLKMTYDGENRTTNNMSGITTSIPDFGDPSTMEVIDVDEILLHSFGDIIERLEAEGYERNVSIRGAQYDWRKGPNELNQYFDDLKTLVEQTYESNGQKSVILLVHSMGALVSRVFLNNQTAEWKDKYIRLEISVAGVWGGTVKAVEAYIRGLVLRLTEVFSSLGDMSDLENPLYNIISGAQSLPILGTILSFSITVVPPDITRTFPSILMLFPSPAIWDASHVLVQTDDKEYTVENIRELFRDLNSPDGVEMYEDLYPYLNTLQNPDVELHCLYGTGQMTVEKIVLKGTLSSDDEEPENGDGDGFVNLQSLEACKLWQNGGKPVMTKSFTEAAHATILSNSDVLDYIITTIKNSN